VESWEGGFDVVLPFSTLYEVTTLKTQSDTFVLCSLRLLGFKVEGIAMELYFYVNL
jgi:hypothetical protein